MLTVCHPHCHHCCVCKEDISTIIIIVFAHNYHMLQVVHLFWTTRTTISKHSATSQREYFLWLGVSRNTNTNTNTQGKIRLWLWGVWLCVRGGKGLHISASEETSRWSDQLCKVKQLTNSDPLWLINSDWSTLQGKTIESYISSCTEYLVFTLALDINSERFMVSMTEPITLSAVSSFNQTYHDPTFLRNGLEYSLDERVLRYCIKLWSK